MARRAFTLIELLVVIAIIATLAGFLFPVYSRARERAQSVACMNNLKQLGFGLYSYLQDYDDHFPMNRLPDGTHAPGNLEGSTNNWRTELFSYVRNVDVMICPSNIAARGWPGRLASHEESRKYPISYALNGSIFHENGGNGYPNSVSLSRIKDPSASIFVMESRWPHPDLGAWTINHASYQFPAGSTNSKYGVFQHHQGRIEMLFCDTHARSMKLRDTLVPNEMWHDSRYNAAVYNGLAATMADEYK